MPKFDRIIHQAYRSILDRDADPSGLAHYGQRMNAGETEAAVRESLIRSAEFSQKNPDGPIPSNRPIRAAFYYPWFPESWAQEFQGQRYEPFTAYKPSLGFYDSSDSSVIRRHLDALQYGRVDAGLLSWWGPETPSDRRMAYILRESERAASPVKWGLYYEGESLGEPTPAAIRSELRYLHSEIGTHPNALRVNGRIVVFVFATRDDGNDMARRWFEGADAGHFYVVLKVYPGYQDSPHQPDSWHQYGPSVPVHRVQGHSYNISPGFKMVAPGQPELARDLDRWRQNVRDMVASGEKWQLITSFNEWGEGTSVESAEEWRSESGYGKFLDVLREIH